MINEINSTSRYISITGDSNIRPYISPGAVGSGMVRWNSNTGVLEVNDGAVWRELGHGRVNINLDPEVEDILSWAREKMAEERKIKDLCNRYPALQKAKANYELILNTIKDEYEDKI